MGDPALIWSYLSREPLLWLTATLLAYWAGDSAFRAAGRRPWVHPVLVAVILLAIVLTVTGTEYSSFFEGAQFVHFMLGPATVALAVPLYANLAQVRRAALPIIAALVAASLTAVVVALGVSKLLGADDTLLASLAPKSATAAVAVGISEGLGGAPTLTAVLVLLTGIFGAMTALPILKLIRVRDSRAQGLAMGVAAHGIGTAQAFQSNETAGTFAGIGMGLNAILTALIAPWALALFV